MARVPKLTRGIHCSLSFLFYLLLSDRRLYIVTSQSPYMIYRCYQLILRVKHFLHKSGAVRSVDWIFIIWGAGLAVTLDNNFDILLTVHLNILLS